MYRKCKACDGRGFIGRDDCASCYGNGFHYTPPRQPLEWIDDRWHCQGQGIHAGECLELHCPDETWLLVRIESSNRGQSLIAFATVHGQVFTRAIDP
jgi:hypothetical protein